MSLSKFFMGVLLMTLAIGAEIQTSVQMGLITASNYVGDREVAWRIKIAGERLGWKVFLDEEEGIRLNYKQLDWVICMLHNNNISNTPCPNYLMVFHPFTFLNEKRRFKSFFHKYDGYLLTINDRETLEKGLKKKNKKFHHISFYPTIYNISYKKLPLNDLVVMIAVWGNRLNDPRFGTLYQLLSQSGFAKFYGRASHPNVDPQKYMGSIPFDGTSVIDVLQKHGIVLVLHSEVHNREAIPSGRIFEAAAASTVIISDENPFVKKHFGDSVFYIDSSGSGESMFQQIQAHINTIFKNPEKAFEMAEKAHQIFVDNFTLERQLLNLKSMHKKVLEHRKKKA